MSHNLREIIRKFENNRKLHNLPAFSQIKSSNFRYVGLNIQKSSAGIVINQTSYATDIDDEHVNINGRSNDAPLEKHELTQLSSITGQINWISSQTRPDLSFDALELSIERNNATVSTMKRAKKIVRKAKETDSKILFQPIGDIVGLKVYTDASYCNLPDGKSSTCGYIIILQGTAGERISD